MQLHKPSRMVRSKLQKMFSSQVHQCCKVMTFWFAGYLSIFCEFLVVDHVTCLLPIMPNKSLQSHKREKLAKQLPIQLKRNLKKRSIVKLTPSSLSRTKLSSMAPIHSRDPINDGSLSPISTSTCWISLCEGTSIDEYCCNLYQEKIVCRDRYAHPHPLSSIPSWR